MNEQDHLVDLNAGAGSHLIVTGPILMVPRLAKKSSQQTKRRWPEWYGAVVPNPSPVPGYWLLDLWLVRADSSAAQLRSARWCGPAS